MDQTEMARLEEACRGMDAETARRVIGAQARIAGARRSQRLREVGGRWTMARDALRKLPKFRCRTISHLNLREPYTQTEGALAMAMEGAGLSFKHRERVAGGVADFWVSGSRGFAMAVLVTGKGRAGADAMRKRGVLTFALSDRALAEGPLKCAQKIAAILNSEVQDEDLSDDKWGMETL